MNLDTSLILHLNPKKAAEVYQKSRSRRLLKDVVEWVP